uniref:Ribonuclease H-like domain-containing protein n=1 Tax=Tanacetum cinerariifolium TaxID=118510 RepID=A0A699KR47_TANCI|nr:ribonuclease H-like domain-containing protein [Tanacetum cinerariifolium]
MHRGITWDKVENLNPQSTPQVLLSFEEYALSVTYPEEVKETLGILIELEPLDETQLEDLDLNTCDHDIHLSTREVLSFDEPELQPQPLPNCLPLDVSLGNKRGLKLPIKPHSTDSFRMKVLDNFTSHTPPSSLMASFYHKDTYWYYHPCINDPKKHYGFKPGLLGQSGSLGVDFSNMEVIENDWELESKEIYFIRRGLNLPVRPKEVENVRINETHHLEHIIQQLIF